MRKHQSRNRLFAVLILVLFIGAFVADIVMPMNNVNVVQAGGEVFVISGFIAVCIGGIIHRICKTDDPKAKEKVADFFKRNRER